MKVTETIVCDKCKKRLADKSCFICKSDICEDCSRNTEFCYDNRNSGIVLDDRSSDGVIICKHCLFTLRSFLTDNKNCKSFTEDVYNLIVENEVLNKLCGEEDV